jgi:hypothetical protein
MNRLLDEISRGRKPNNSGNDFLRFADTITVRKHMPKDATGSRFELKGWMVMPIEDMELNTFGHIELAPELQEIVDRANAN